MAKERKEKKFKKILFLICLGVAAYIGARQIKSYEMQQSIADKIIRFHIMANSDTAEDQELKLKVRDEIGIMMEPLLGKAKNIEDSRAIVKENLDVIEQQAEKTVRAYGYNYGVTAELTEASFPEKSYGAYTFASGDYEALEITIGNGEGHNWWCVMYPNMCFVGSMYQEPDESRGRALEKVLTEEEYASIIEKGNYSLKCRYFTIFNKWI